MVPKLPPNVRAMSPAEYRTLFEGIVESGRPYGPPGGGYGADYTKLNLARTRRIERTFKPSAEAQGIMAAAPPMAWLIITEPWCGDSAQNLPVLLTLAALAPSISVHITLRDDGSDLIDHHLSNGTRSIPKLVAFHGDGRELFSWGPRPANGHALVLRNKELPEGEQLGKDALAEKLHRWYHENGGEATQNEMIALVKAHHTAP